MAKFEKDFSRIKAAGCKNAIISIYNHHKNGVLIQKKEISGSLTIVTLVFSGDSILKTKVVTIYRLEGS